MIEQPPKPLGVGFRFYSPEQVRRIKFIRQAQQIGFSPNETKELLSLRADPCAHCSAVRGSADHGSPILDAATRAHAVKACGVVDVVERLGGADQGSSTAYSRC